LLIPYPIRNYEVAVQQKEAVTNPLFQNGTWLAHKTQPVGYAPSFMRRGLISRNPPVWGRLCGEKVYLIA
jgi:hypothetical protein